jgi:hypothetical protein
VNAALFKNIQGGFDLYGIDANDEGELLASWSDDELDALPETPTTSKLLHRNTRFKVAMYKLTSGEFEVTAGPDVSGKMFTCTFDGYAPSDNVTRSFFIRPLSAS